ncbi:MAG: CHASE2 domain-containing protein [Burkholderiales bacterium]
MKQPSEPGATFLHSVRDAVLSALVSGRGRTIGTILLAVFLLVSFLPTQPLFAGLQFALFDGYQRLSPRIPSSAPAVIIAIDQKSLDQLGQWPWPRTIMANLIQALGKIGPAAIGVDVLFSEPDRMSAANVARVVERLDPEIARRLKKLPDNDSILAAALRQHPVALGVAGAETLEPGIRATGRAAPFRVRGEDPSAFLRSFAGATRSLEKLDDAAAGHGLISADPGAGVIRSAPLYASIGGMLMPALSVELLRLAAGEQGFTVLGNASGSSEMQIGDVVLPTDESGSIWVHFSLHDPRRYVSAIDVLRGDVDVEKIRGKLALIGATGIGLLDYKTTPLGEQIPGVEIHAQILEGIFENSLLQRPAMLRWIESGLVAFCGVILIFGIPAVRPRYSAAIYIGIMVGLAALGFALYYWFHLLLSIVLPAATANVLFGVMLSGTLIDEDRQRRALRHALEIERESAARAAGELEAAKRIQMGMLPPTSADFYQDRRFELEATIEPAKSVGGDLYDFFKLGDDRLFFLVGDVAGKGLPASIFMAVSKALYKSAVLRSQTSVSPGIGEVMQAANEEIARDNPEMLFVTVIAGILDLHTGIVELCNAGHDAPLSLRPGASGPVRIDFDGGPPLCVIADFVYPSHTCQLARGEMLCLYTDGITEAMNARGELFGKTRLRGVLERSMKQRDATVALIRNIRQDVQDFVGQTERSDDLTILALLWNGPDA